MRYINNRILLLLSAVLLIVAAWLWDCSGNMKWAWRDEMRLEDFSDGSICLQSEKGSTVEFQQEGVEANSGEPMVLSGGATVVWRGITIKNDYPRWVIKSGGNQISPEQENAEGRQQQYRVYADKGEVRIVLIHDRGEYEMSPHAMSWLLTCVLKLEQYLRVGNTMDKISSFLLGCILVIVFLHPFRDNILSVCSLIWMSEVNSREWKTGSIGDKSLQWREKKLSWWMKMLGARNSYVCFRTPDGEQKVASTRIQEVRQLLWSFKYNQDGEIVGLWKRLEPKLLPVDVSLWVKVRYAWKQTGIDNALVYAVNVSCRRAANKRLIIEGVAVCSVLLLLAAIGNLICVGRMIVKEVSAHEAVTQWGLVNEAGCRLDLVRENDRNMHMEILKISNDAEVSWSGVRVQAQRTGFVVSGTNDKRVICEQKADTKAEHVSGMHGIAFDIGNDGQILRQRERETVPLFEIPFNSMEIHRTISEDFFKYNLAHLVNIIEWLCVVALVLLSPLRAICFSVGSILCLSAENDEQNSCRKEPSLFMKLLGVQISYRVINAAGKKWICPTNYPGLFVYEQHREDSVIERFCSEDLLESDAPVIKKIMYAIMKAF